MAEVGVGVAVGASPLNAVDRVTHVTWADDITLVAPSRLALGGLKCDFMGAAEAREVHIQRGKVEC